ncbi:MAG: polymer-forming cytoskeletal protein [Anaerolineaceae bacterium]|nr:polymer-forming cytoskeletal protein [Anaerolineaceae bacterium]
MFRRSQSPQSAPTMPIERVTSVLGPGITWGGDLSGSGGVRIESIFEGEITLRGLLVVGETGRVTCREIKANTVVVAGAVRGNITAEKVEIRATGRVWGDVTTTSFSTEEGAFLRGQIRMEEEIEIILPPTRTFSEGVADGNIPPEPEKKKISKPKPEKAAASTTASRSSVQRDENVWKKKA